MDNGKIIYDNSENAQPRLLLSGIPTQQTVAVVKRPSEL